MTTSSRDAIVCACGHEGAVACKENDQPFSGLWEAFRLEGFAGRDFTITSYADMPSDILAYMQPRCPACDQIGQVRWHTPK